MDMMAWSNMYHNINTHDQYKETDVVSLRPLNQAINKEISQTILLPESKPCDIDLIPT